MDSSGFIQQTNRTLLKNTIAQDVIAFEDFKAMSQQDRRKLLLGPKVAISSQGGQVTGAPKRLLMAVSPIVNEYFTTYPNEGTLCIQDVSKEALLYIVQYLKDVCESSKFYSLPWLPSTIKNALIYQTGCALGMEKNVYHVLVHLKNEIESNNGLIPYADLDAMLNATECDVKDPLFLYIAKTYCRLRHQELIPDSEEFAAWLEGRPTLKASMADIDKEHAANRAKFQAAQLERQHRRELAAKRAESARRRARRQSDTETLPAITSTLFGPGVHHIGADTARKLGKEGFAL